MILILISGLSAVSSSPPETEVLPPRTNSGSRASRIRGIFERERQHNSERGKPNRSRTGTRLIGSHSTKEGTT